MDYTKLVQKLLPQDQVSGDPGLELRVGVVDSLGTGSAVNVFLSGTLITNVPRLGDAAIQAGAVVQILSYRGSLLVLGQASIGTDGQSPGLGLWARGQATFSSAALTTSLTSILATNTVTFIKNRVYEVKTHGGVSSSTANVYADLRPYRAGPATQLGEFYRFHCPVSSVAFNASASGFYFTVAANVSGAVALYGSASTAAVLTHIGTASGTPRNVEVYDVGDIAKFTGVAVW